jgi:hypothetical protein
MRVKREIGFSRPPDPNGRRTLFAKNVNESFIRGRRFLVEYDPPLNRGDAGRVIVVLQQLPKCFAQRIGRPHTKTSFQFRDYSPAAKTEREVHALMLLSSINLVLRVSP